MANPTQTVTIEKLVQGGRGLARHESQVLFVREVVPGETVSIIGGPPHKGIVDATVSKILRASPDRVIPPCRVYRMCGGCQFQHIHYHAQLAYKHEIFTETLARVGKIQMRPIPTIIAAPNPYGYRNVIRFRVFREGTAFELGFHEEGTHQPVPAAECLLIPDETRTLVQEVNARLAAQRYLPLALESVAVRRSTAFGSTLLAFRAEPATRQQALRLMSVFQDIPDVVGLVVTAGRAKRWQRWVDGQDWIADRLDDLIFRISDRSFAQANWMLNETLTRTVAQWVEPAPGVRVLELYAGIGSLGLPLAVRGALVTEVESNPYAVADARHTAKINHIGRCRFRSVRAEAMLDAVQKEDYDVVLVDPPRIGISRECVDALARLHIPRLLYLSCDASTLARDLGRLCGAGYHVSRLQSFDMFPQTAHLETLVELTC